jgi:DNA-binding CsgD family transcriptional regulator/tetratricopeptide (TPR) repeat protein
MVSAAADPAARGAGGVRHETPGANAAPMTRPPLRHLTGIPRRPPLVGRDAELAALDEQVALARTGAFRVVLVTGEPGIGKSRLVNEFAERQRDSAVVVGSRALELGMTYSLALWVEAFERLLNSAPTAEVRRLCGSSVRDLALVLRSARRALGSGPAPSGAELGHEPGREPDPERLLRALTELLDNLSADSPVIVVLDDVHNADASSWQALYHIARWLPGRPVLVLATARTADIDRHPVAGQVLVGLEQDDALVRLGLQALADESVAALTRAVLGADDVPPTLTSWLAERARGYPLFVIGLLRALLEEGADLAQPRLARVPEGLAGRVALLVGRLDPPDRELLEILAVIGGRVDPDGLARVLGRPRDRLGVPLERLTRSRLVVEYEAAHRLSYEIAHPLVQDAIYESIGGTRRRSFHRLVGRALVAGGNFGAAAPHFLRSADSGDPEAVDTLVRAVRQAEERNLYQETLPLLAALLDVLGPDDPRWLDVLEAMTWRAEWVIDHLVENGAATAIAVMRRIERQLAASGDRLREGIVQFRLASFLAIGAGQPAQAVAACQRARELFAAEGHADLALLALNELGWIRYCAGDLPGHRALALDVCENAEKCGDQMALIQSLGALGCIAAIQGQFAEADRHLRRSMDLARAADKHYRYVWNLTMSALALALVGRLAASTAIFERAVQHPEASDAVTAEWFAQCDWLSGRLDDVVRRISQSAARRPLAGSRRRAWAAAFAARAAAERGQPDTAARLLALASATYDRPDDVPGWSNWLPWAAGSMAALAGDPAGGHDLLDHAAGRLRAMGAAVFEAVVLVDATEAAATAGRADAAVAYSRRLAELSRTIEGEMAGPLAQLAWAHSLFATGSAAAAATPAADAADALDRIGCRLYGAMAAEVAGIAATSRGAAVEMLARAADAYNGCGAVVRRDRVAERLAGLGYRGRLAAMAGRGPASLTPRELDVARLAARGYTAAEIGRQLFIGTRTVETHLAHARAKLGCRSKRELVRFTSELDRRPEAP